MKPHRTRLFHVSETAGLTHFAPQPKGDGPPRVWAISEARLPNYMLPRDCPRVTYYAGPATTAADVARFLGSSAAVVAIESSWLGRCWATALSVYEFDPAPFRLADEVAGYYTATTAVRPVNVQRLAHPLTALLARDVELRIRTSLWPLREAVAGSSLAFSIIRFRLAAAPPVGFETAFPMPR